MKPNVKMWAQLVATLSRQAVHAALTLTLMGAGGVASAQATTEAGCPPPVASTSAPQDYRLTTTQSRIVVERRHFTPPVETLLRGESTTQPGPDISYTLRKYPNHHRALISMMRLGERHKTEKPPGTERTIGCWFDLALSFTPDDTVVRGLYATHLKSQGRKNEAMHQLAIARRHAADNPFSNYSIGAIYFDLGEFQLALELAHQARRLGDERTKLEQALRSSGHWQDPPATPQK